MSARDRLWHLYQYPDSASAFGDALDAFAHELAEQLRAQAQRIDDVHARDTGRHAEDAAVRRRAWNSAGDLIDPYTDDYGRPVRPVSSEETST
jgi:glycogen debranching enzyme